MADKELARKMQEMFTDLQKLDTPSALSLLNERLSSGVDPSLLIEMKITKAKLLQSLGHWQQAVELLDECARSPEADESAAYFAAEILVEQMYLQEAVGFLETAERQIEISGSNYYRDCIFLLHAFCEAKQGRVGRSRQLLDEVTDQNEVLFWLRADPVISVFTVRNLIAGGG